MAIDAFSFNRHFHREHRIMIKKTFAAAALTAVIFASMTASNARAHGKIVASEPTAGAELQTGPSHIRLRFNENLESAFSKIGLVDANARAITLPGITVDKMDPKVMFTDVPTLQTGQYRVRWSAMTRDGHKTTGEFGFKVSPASR